MSNEPTACDGSCERSAGGWSRNTLLFGRQLAIRNIQSPSNKASDDLGQRGGGGLSGMECTDARTSPYSTALWGPRRLPPKHYPHCTRCEAHPRTAVGIRPRSAKTGPSVRIPDGGWWGTDGGWWGTDGGWWVTGGGWWATDGGWRAWRWHGGLGQPPPTPPCPRGALRGVEAGGGLCCTVGGERVAWSCSRVRESPVSRMDWMFSLSSACILFICKCISDMSLSSAYGIPSSEGHRHRCSLT